MRFKKLSNCNELTESVNLKSKNSQINGIATILSKELNKRFSNVNVITLDKDDPVLLSIVDELKNYWGSPCIGYGDPHQNNPAELKQVAEQALSKCNVIAEDCHVINTSRSHMVIYYNFRMQDSVMQKV